MCVCVIYFFLCSVAVNRVATFKQLDSDLSKQARLFILVSKYKHNRTTVAHNAQLKLKKEV